MTFSQGASAPWAWVPPHLAIAWHDRLIEQFGGAPGLRDAGLLEGALDRPKNLTAYQPDVTRNSSTHSTGLAWRRHMPLSMAISALPSR